MNKPTITLDTMAMICTLSTLRLEGIYTSFFCIGYFRISKFKSKFSIRKILLPHSYHQMKINLLRPGNSGVPRYLVSSNTDWPRSIINQSEKSFVNGHLSPCQLEETSLICRGKYAFQEKQISGRHVLTVRARGLIFLYVWTVILQIMTNFSECGNSV